MAGRTVLLTGGAGYIGSHTAVAMLQAGYQVIIADDFRNSHDAVLKQIKYITDKDVNCYTIDVCEESALETVFQQHKIDAVIHFAGWKAVGESVQNPLKYYRNNLDSTLTLLETMKKYQVKNFVFSSSATVYGIPQEVPLTETMPTSCLNPYGWTKWMNEQILRDVSEAQPDFSVVILRYFNPIGAHESGLLGEYPQGIPSNLLPYISQVAARKIEKLYIYGNDYPTIDGTGVRDYIHIMDLAEGHLAAVDYANSHSGLEIFNLGTGQGYSVLEIVKAFERTCRAKIPYEFVARRPGDVAVCYADPSKAEKKLGWKAKRSLDDMCNHAWQWQLNMPHLLASESE